jgi:hypothetical protein
MVMIWMHWAFGEHEREFADLRQVAYRTARAFAALGGIF